MATLHEYFVKDGADNLTLHKTFEIKNEDGSIALQPIARLHYDFEAHALYISFYVPASDDIKCPEALLLNTLPTILEWPRSELQVVLGRGDERSDAKDLVFTGRVVIYSERPVPQELQEQLNREAKSVGHTLVFRSQEYAEFRSKSEKPAAFISHDSRDKRMIAEPLALELQKRLCPVCQPKARSPWRSF
jgi:hypothetical protein